MPPQEEMPGFPIEAPHVLHLIQEWMGGFQIISLIIGALGLWIVTLKCFKMEKSLMELFNVFLDLFPEREVLAVIIEIADLQVMSLLLNLAWFLANQIVLRRLIKAAVTATLHCGDKPFS
jgi:hypothetical protein